MKKSLLVALFAAMPIMAQECPQMPEAAPQMPAAPQMVMPHGPRPQLTEEQKAEMKAKFEARKAEFEKQAPQAPKFDMNKGERRPNFDKQGRRPHGPQFGDKAPKAPEFGMQRGERRPHFGMKHEGRRPNFGGKAPFAPQFGGKAPFGPKFGPQAPKCEKH